MRVGRRGNPLWTRAPLVLRRYPAVLAGIAAGALLLAIAAAASPLYVSAAASASLGQALAEAGRFSSGIEIVRTDRLHLLDRRTGRSLPGYTFTARSRLLAQAAAPIPDVGSEIFTILGPRIAVTTPGGSTPLDVRLLSRTAAIDNVRRLTPRSHDGFWLEDGVAAQLGIHAGDELELHSELAKGRAGVRVRVAGIYRSLLGHDTPYWGALRPQIGSPSAPVPPPPFLIGDTASVARLSAQLGEPVAEFFWELPLRPGTRLTVPGATTLAGAFARLQADLQRQSSPLARAFRCVQCSFIGRQVAYSTDLGTSIRTAQDAADAERGPIDLLAVAGALVALAVLAAAGAFSLSRRRVEAAFLYARGTSAWTVAATTTIEAVLPVAAGAAAGLGIAWALVATLGPNGPVDASAIRSAAVAAGIRIPLALLLLALTAGAVFARRTEARHPVRRALARVPWELVPLVVAGVLLAQLLRAGAPAEGPGTGVDRPTVALLLFPLCFIAGCAGLAARALRLPLRRAHKRVGRIRSPAAYLAVVRLARAERLAVLLVAACALALGVFIYAQTVVASYAENVRARSHLFLGSDVQGAIGPEEQGPSRFPYPITRVTVLYQGGALPDGELVDILAIDPTTFASVAYWRAAYASRPLRELVARLRSRGRGPVPVLLVGAGGEPASLRTSGATLPIRVVGTARAFPGMSFVRPLLVADASTLRRGFLAAGGGNPLLDPSVFAQLWAKGPETAVARALGATPAQPEPIVGADEVLRQPEFTAFTRTFAFMKSLGLAAGVLAVVATALYLQARQRARVVSTALARRMGLAPAQQRAAVVLELAGLLAAAFLLAVVLGLASARLLFARIEPLRSLSPVLLFDTPVALVLATALALAAVVLAGGLLAARAAERANLAQVMRLEA